MARSVNAWNACRDLQKTIQAFAYASFTGSKSDRNLRFTDNPEILLATYRFPPTISYTEFKIKNSPEKKKMKTTPWKLHVPPWP